MSILFKKQKFQTGGTIEEGAGIIREKGISPYRRAQSGYNPEQEKYVTEYLGSDFPQNTGYTYGYQRNPDFAKSYNAAVAANKENAVFAGDPNTPMFTMYPGSKYQRGERQQGGEYNYHLPKDTPGRTVTVGEYRANPGAFKYATTGATDFNQFDKYLGIGK